MFDFKDGLTHAGSFHADDVFSTAFLKILNPDIVISRSYIVPNDYKGIVFDIGNGEFDHHSLDRETRENGVMFAAFGKLWRKYAHLIVSEFVKVEVDKNFISYLDNTDNTGEQDTLCEVIYSFNPFWDEDKTESNIDLAFNKAVDIAGVFLKRQIQKFQSIEIARERVTLCLENNINGLVVLEDYIPWHTVLLASVAKVVLYPSNRGGYNLEVVPHSDFEFPKEWWGSRDIAHVEGLTFCHANGFMCAFKDFETAKKAALDLLR